MEANKESFSEMQSDLMGLSKDGRQLSLYKDAPCSSFKSA